MARYQFPVKTGISVDMWNPSPGPALRDHPLPAWAGRGFPKTKSSRVEPDRSRRRESALTFTGLKVRGLTSSATRFKGSFDLQLLTHSSWERWRLAGEFRFSVPDWPAGRRRSQEVHGGSLIRFFVTSCAFPVLMR